MKWHIIGSGAIGLKFADLLNQQGAEIELILRNPAQLKQFERLANRFTVEQTGDSRQIACHASLAADPGPIAHLLIPTKAFDAIAAFEQVRDQLAPNAEVVLLLNGYGVQQRLAADYPGLKLWAASTTSGAHRPESFTTVLAGQGVTQVGALTSAAHDLPSLWQGISEVRLSENIDQILWQKLAINCCINPLTVIFDCANGGLLANPLAKSRLRAIATEIEQISKLLKKPLFNYDLIEQVEHVAQRTGQNISSMLQDYRAHRKTELAQITGAFIEVASSAGIPTPVSTLIAEELRNLNVQT